MIKTRLRFPNFVCDGFPLGPPGDPAYYDEFETTEDFYNLEWVKEKDGCVGWFQVPADEYSGPKIMAVYENSDGTGSYLCHAILEEGELDMDTYDFNEEGVYVKIMERYGLKPDPRNL
jgi:hypothetical protein